MIEIGESALASRHMQCSRRPRGIFAIEFSCVATRVIGYKGALAYTRSGACRMRIRGRKHAEPEGGFQWHVWGASHPVSRIKVNCIYQIYRNLHLYPKHNGENSFVAITGRSSIRIYDITCTFRPLAAATGWVAPRRSFAC